MSLKFLSILEVIAVFLVGATLGSLLLELVGLKAWLSQSGSLLYNIPIDFEGLTWRVLVSNFFKYGSIFLLVGMMLNWRKDNGVKRLLGLKQVRGNSWKKLKRILLILAVGGLIPKVLFLCWEQGIIEGGPHHWFIFREAWDGDFWGYMLVGSIILPPIVEDLFFRGYMHGRLEQSFGPMIAILLTALIFTLFHTQYLKPDLLSIGLVFSLFISALVLSYARFATGSIIPGMIAHSLVNIPTSDVYSIIIISVFLLLIISNTQYIFNHGKLMFKLIHQN